MKTSFLTSLFTLLFTLSSVSYGEKDTPKKAEVAAKVDNIFVMFETTSGDIKIELYPNEAPITVKNFLAYVDEGFYNGAIFHRVVPDFVVQGGGFTFDFQRKPTHDPIKNESDNGLKNELGTLSMARTNIVDSATSQFFINLKANPFLDYQQNRHGYAVFGKVTDGMKVVKEIEAAPRGIHRMYPEAPNEAIIIKKAYRLEKKK